MKVRLSNQEENQVQEWDAGAIPIFPQETQAAERAGFVETNNEKCLCWTNGDFMVVREAHSGRGRKDRIRYHAYRQVYKTVEIDGKQTQVPIVGNFTMVDKMPRQVKMVLDMFDGQMKEVGFRDKHPGHSTIQAAIAACLKP